MSNLRAILKDSVSTLSSTSEVALLLSGGLDSFTVGIACEEVGKRVVAYTYELEGIPSLDRPKAEILARLRGWPLYKIRVPTAGLSSTFLRLAIQYGCLKKVHFEVLYPLLFLIPQIRQTEILTGWNADDHYGNTAKVAIEFSRLRREGRTQTELNIRFNEIRRSRYEQFDAKDSTDTFWFASRLAAECGKCLIDPYATAEIREFFFTYSHHDLSPIKKPLVRQAFSDVLESIPDSSIAVGVKLQKGGGVHELFKTLVDDPTVNRFEKRYTTISPLCQRWGREVRGKHAEYAEMLCSLPQLPQATVAAPASLLRHSMFDVYAASMRELFTVISLFGGGGGSSTGFRLAGGNVLAVNEFVREAARTYSRNFPRSLVDTRDIRELLRRNEHVLEFLARVGLVFGALDILDGSPPCSEFSQAGNGYSDPTQFKAYSDRKQRDIASLPFEYARFAIIALPKITVMENVPELATRGKDILYGVADMLGQHYLVNWKVLVASDYGVPQKRRRLFVIGVRKDVAEAIGIQDDAGILNLFPAPESTGVTVRDALAGLVQTAEDIRPWFNSARTTSLAAAIASLPKSPPRPFRAHQLSPRDRRRFNLDRMTRCAWDEPALTLTVTGQQPGGLAGSIHPEEDRKFTLPELKRLTGLPDDFILTGTVSQAAERICRMVPPPLTRAIAQALYERVLKPYRETIT